MPAAADDAARFRLAVVDHALRLFADKGYEATTVDEIAEAAGISRRTFFRQFRAKEDVVFADHEAQLAQARSYLDAAQGDPWDAVCEAVVQVFERFTQTRELAARRYRVVRQIPALRDREIVTVFRYERLFTDYLRAALPQVPDLALIQFSAAVTATHNYLLRRMVQAAPATGPEAAACVTTGGTAGAAAGYSQSDAGVADLRAALAGIARDGRAAEEMVVAVFPRHMPPGDVADLLAHRLGNL